MLRLSRREFVGSRAEAQGEEASRDGKHGIEVAVKTRGLNGYAEQVAYAGRIISAMEKVFGYEVMGGALLVSMFPDGEE